MLTSLRVKNFKSLGDVEIELGRTVLFVGPNNSGKTSALQALALWEIGLRKWAEKSALQESVTINRRDLVSSPVPDSNLLWRDLRVRNSRNIPIEILVSGLTGEHAWDCGLEFEYANEESFYCRPAFTPVPKEAMSARVAFLPPMSGLAASEDRLHQGAINVRIGEGRTAEVIRNLCFEIHAANDQTRKDKTKWKDLVALIDNLFGVKLDPPQFVTERGQITMSYSERRGIHLDLASSGRGLQQTLLLLAHLYTHPGSVLLLDEPDAHLEILRQRQIYQILTETAEAQECQVIAASHSEILLNEAAERDIVVAFLGKPHRIDDRGTQLLKSLKSISYDQYYQAEQTGWVLYLEGSTDLAVLQALAELLKHPAAEVLKRPFVSYAGNVPSKAREHFWALREAKPDLVGVAIFDSTDLEMKPDGPLRELKWRQREIENYICFPQTLLAYAGQTDAGPGTLFEQALREDQDRAMRHAVGVVSGALAKLRKPDPFGPDIKASDEFLTPVFAEYFETLELRNQMTKTNFHILARFVPPELIDSEVREKLDLVVETADRARPVR